MRDCSSSNVLFYHFKVEKIVDDVLIHQVPAMVLGGSDDLKCNIYRIVTYLPRREQIWIPWGNGSDIGADRQLVDYDSVSSDELNKEMSSQTLGGNFDLYAKFSDHCLPPRDNKSGTFGKGLVLVTSQQLVDYDSDSSDESNEDRGFVKPHCTTSDLSRSGYGDFLAGTSGFWSYERSETLSEQMSAYEWREE